MLAAVYGHADIEQDMGGGATLMRLSRDAARALPRADQLSRLGLLVAEDGTVITVMQVHERGSNRRYRRVRH